jgi:hypothetical protein
VDARAKLLFKPSDDFSAVLILERRKAATTVPGLSLIRLQTARYPPSIGMAVPVI